MKLHQREHRINQLLGKEERKEREALSQTCEIVCNSDKIRAKAAEIAKESSRTNREAAFSVCGDSIAHESGNEKGVNVPQCKLGAPKLVVHTHTISPDFSEADRKVSYKYPVCMIYKGKIKCMYQGKEEVCSECNVH